MYVGLVLGKIKEKIGGKIGKKKVYLVQVPRRGGSVLLARIEAKDEQDAIKTLYENVHRYVDKPYVRQAKYLHLIDTETQEKIKVENPLYAGGEEEEEERRSRKKKDELDVEEFAKMIQLDMMQEIAKAAAAGAATMVKSVLGATGEVVKTAVTEIVKEAIELRAGNPVQMQQAQQVNWLEAAKLFLDVVKNWDKIKKNAPEVIRTLQEELMRGEEGGQSSE